MKSIRKSVFGLLWFDFGTSCMMLKLTIICIKIFPAFAEDKKPYLSHLMPLKIVDFLWDQANVGIGVQVSSWGPTAWHLSLASGYSGQKGPVAARVPPCTLALALRMVNCEPGGRGPGSCCGVAMEPAHCCPPPQASLGWRHKSCSCFSTRSKEEAATWRRVSATVWR